MTDQLGYRKKFGVILPSTNTIVEPEFYRMTVPGVTPHVSRIHIRDQKLDSDEAFEEYFSKTFPLALAKLKEISERA